MSEQSEQSFKVNADTFINPPIPYIYTDDDIRKEFEIIKDKKKVAAVYLIPVKEVTRILKNEW